MKMIKLWGGFHLVEPININWDEKHVSKNQVHKIEKHFCGMPDCNCGGALRGAMFDGIGKYEAREFFQQLKDASSE